MRHTLTDTGELAEPKTPKARRAIELPARATAALRAQRERLFERGLRGSPWVFPIEDGDWKGEARRSRAVSRAFNAAVERVDAELRERDPESHGLPTIRFHDLRHSAATLRLANGDHQKVVCEMLAHASIEITLDTYAHVMPGMQREAADRFDAVL